MCSLVSSDDPDEVLQNAKTKMNFSSEKHGSSVVRHLPLVLEVPGSIPARGQENFGVQTSFL